MITLKWINLDHHIEEPTISEVLMRGIAIVCQVKVLGNEKRISIVMSQESGTRE